VTIWWLKKPSRVIAFISVGVQWTFAILFGGIGYGLHTHAPRQYYATPTPYWCWISQDFQKDRLAGEYVWYWTALLGSFILYLLLFLLHLGVITPSRSWYTPKVLEDNKSSEDDSGKHQTEVQSNTSRTPRGLWTVIWYPIVYSVMILPLSVVRWIAFRQTAKYGSSHVSPVATFFVVTLFSLSGVFDAVTYILTRRWFFVRQRNEPEAPGPVANGST